MTWGTSDLALFRCSAPDKRQHSAFVPKLLHPMVGAAGRLSFGLKQKLFEIPVIVLFGKLEVGLGQIKIASECQRVEMASPERGGQLLEHFGSAWVQENVITVSEVGLKVAGFTVVVPVFIPSKYFAGSGCRSIAESARSIRG